MEFVVVLERTKSHRLEKRVKLENIVMHSFLNKCLHFLDIEMPSPILRIFVWMTSALLLESHFSY